MLSSSRPNQSYSEESFEATAEVPEYMELRQSLKDRFDATKGNETGDISKVANVIVDSVQEVPKEDLLRDHYFWGVIATVMSLLNAKTSLPIWRNGLVSHVELMWMKNKSMNI